MLNRNVILGLITIGILIIMMAYMAVTPSPLGNWPYVIKIP